MAAEAGSPLPGIADRFGLNIHHSEYEPEAFPLAAEVRATWVRLAAWWRLMERQQGQIDFGYLDSSVDAARRHGLKVLIVFASVPAWANHTPATLGIMDPNAALPPADPQFFQKLVSSVVARYRGKVDAYEIWNEPNYPTFWNGDYGRFIDEILIPGAKAAKAVDPVPSILGPAIDKHQDKFKQAVLKACPVLDVLSCHLYYKSAAEFLAKADALYALVKTQCRKPLWVTEFGIDSWATGEDVQARELVAALDGLRKRPYLQRLFLFQWRDGYWPAPKQKGWGLVGNSIEGFRRRKSFWAVQDLVLGSLSLPGVAGSPQPADGATNVPLAAPLSWSAGRAAKSHRLSLGTATPPPFLGEQAATTFTPPTPLQHGQTYVWKVDEAGDGGPTEGRLWSFTVEEDPASAIADVVVRIRKSSPFFLTVVQGQGCAACAPVRSLVLPGTAGEIAGNAWTVVSPATGPTDLTFLLPAGAAGQVTPDQLSIALSGLRPGALYRVFARFVTTTQQDAHNAAVRMGLDPASMTLYSAGTPGAAIVRQNGRWGEREVLLGTAPAGNGSLQVLLDAKGAAEAAGWSGLRLQAAPPSP